MAKKKSNSKESMSPNKERIGNQILQNQHFESIMIEQFRCFSKLSIDSLKRVNLFGGMNNVGKSTLLEAIFLLLGRTNTTLLLTINSFRGIEKYEGYPDLVQEILWNHLFHNLENNPKITVVGHLGNTKKISLEITHKQSDRVISAINGTSLQTDNTKLIDRVFNSLEFQYKDENGKTYKVEMKVGEQGITLEPPKVSSPFQGVFLPSRRRILWSEVATRYGQLELTRTNFDLVSALRIIEPRLLDITTILGASGPMLYGDIGLERKLPLADMGDGLVSLMDKLLAIATVPHGIVLFDEIENGLHFSILEKVWSILNIASELFDVQIFATTHSMECIRAAHEAFKARDTYDITYHRLEKGKENIEVIDLSKDALEMTLESGWEIR